jgi:hypothetical protein
MKAKLFAAVVASAAGLLLAGCGQNTTTPASPPAQGTNAAPAGTSTNAAASSPTNATPNYGSGNPLTAPADYVGAVVQAQKYSEKQIDLAYVNHAIQEFNAAEGRYPKSLQEMVDMHYLGKIPQAPYGYKIVYDPNAGRISVVRQ